MKPLNNHINWLRPFVLMVTTVLISGISLSCGGMKKSGSSQSKSAKSESNEVIPEGKIKGKVSHELKSGCGSLVIFKDADGNEVVLIPSPALTTEADVDGKIIYFTYRPLRMPQPAGCTKGIPAAINDVSFPSGK